MQFSLIISPGPANWANNFRNKIFSTYICHSIRNYGLYLFNENLFLWENLCIGKVINYDCWPIKFKYNLYWGFHSWREYVIYPILLSCAQNKGSIFGVAFGGILYCLPTEITWIWILPPGSTFMSCKVSCWHPCQIGFEFYYPGDPM